MGPDSQLGQVVETSDLPGEFSDRVIEAFHARMDDTFAIALSGAKGVERCYRRLAELGAREIDWWMVDVYWTEDRCVPRDHPGSSYRVVMENLLERVGAANALYPMDCSSGPHDYQLRLADLGRLDVVVVSLQPDGSIAGIAPGSPAARPDQSSLVSHGPFGPDGSEMLTLTTAGLSRARLLICLVSGAEARRAFDTLCSGRDDPPFPARNIRPGQTLWMLDSAS